MKWHDIRDPHDPELDRLAAEYHLHPLHIEDCRNRGQRGKVEEGAGYEFVVLKAAEMSGDEELVFHDLDVFVGPDWAITVAEGNPATFDRLLGPIRASQPGSPAQLLYRIFDASVDSYLPVMDRLDEVIDELEETVLANPGPGVLARIFGALRTGFASVDDVSACSRAAYYAPRPKRGARSGIWRPMQQDVRHLLHPKQEVSMRMNAHPRYTPGALPAGICIRLGVPVHCRNQPAQKIGATDPTPEQCANCTSQTFPLWSVFRPVRRLSIGITSAG